MKLRTQSGLLICFIASFIRVSLSKNTASSLSLHKKIPFFQKSEEKRVIYARGDSPINAPNELNRNEKSMLRYNCHGGACQDSSPILFLKIAVGATLETLALLSLIIGSALVSSKFTALPSFFGLSLLQWLSLFLVIFFPSIIGAFIDGGLSAASNQVLSPNMTPGDPGWYANLKKPSWNPPGWLFPIMWLIVSKPTQLIGVARILNINTQVNESKEMNKFLSLPIGSLTVYCSQLALGDAWNKVFFGLQCPGRGAAVITIFWTVLLATAYLFGMVDSTAGMCMLPTCGWVFIATALNWSIYLRNK